MEKPEAAASTKQEEKKKEEDEEAEVGSVSAKLTWNERFSRSAALHPCRHYLAAWAAVLTMTMITLSAGWFDAQAFSSDDWADPTSAESKQLDAYLSAKDNSDTTDFFNTQPVEFRTQPVSYVAATMIYAWKDQKRTDDVFTAENVQAICEFERLIFGHPDFPIFCVTKEADGIDTECTFENIPMISAVFYNASFEEMLKCDLLDESLVEEVRSNLLSNQGGLFFFDDAVEDNINANSPRTRSFFPFGGPLGPDSTDGSQSFLVPMGEDEDDSFTFYDVWLFDVVEKIDKELGVEDAFFRSGYFDDALLGDGQLTVRYHSASWDLREFDQTFYSESLIVIFAVLVVALLMYYHIKSVSVVALGVTSNMMSVPVALFIYRGILQIDYFTPMHIITFFLIIGIGADNIFVFFDAWMHSKYLWRNGVEKDFKHLINSKEEAAAHNRFGTGDGDMETKIYRLKYTMTVASSSIFNTMSTTFAAFMATAFNPLAPIAGFGVFAAIVVMCNYFFVFVFSAPLMVLHEDYFQKWACCFGRCPKCQKSKDESEEKTNSGDGTKLDNASEDELEAEAFREQEDRSLEGILFDKYYVPIMLKCFPWLQIVLVSLNLIMFAVMITEAVQLELPEAVEEIYPEGHMYRKFYEVYTTQFAGGAEADFDNAFCSFGISDIDRDGFKKLNPAGFRGEAVFDDAFDLAPSASQLHFLSICEDLRNLDCTPDGSSEPLKGCLGPEPDVIVFPDSLICVLEQFYDHMNTTQQLSKQNLLDIGDNDPLLFYDLLQNFSLTDNNADLLGFYGDELKFIAIAFVTSTPFVRPSSERVPVYDLLRSFLREKDSQAPEGLDFFGLAGRGLAYISGEQSLIPGLFSGFAISFPVAYIVLLYGTDNIVLATFALISIIGIVVSVLGTVHLRGSPLGYIQTISAIMVVGLSVDYTVHIGHMYDIAATEGHVKRQDRFAVAARRMGPTVFAGYLTTAASAGMMFFCQLTLFPTMGGLILSTVSFSLEVALGFYMPLCLLIGPEHDFGKISVMIGSARDFVCRRKRSSTDEDADESALRAGL